ncbi:unnamed protein product [Soboliphyme baturini]|uniref:WAC domain-containing protein n=1 Tax=Soboliphyme baturini TaxID=241478 RepID=A0A183IMA2_9BILA|nr:unnamed protein product [Soboliphyme baturini]
MPIYRSRLYTPEQVGFIEDGTSNVGDVSEENGLTNPSTDRLTLDVKCSDPVWACRSTGQAVLTFADALKCERKCRQEVISAFPKAFEKPILELIHHSINYEGIIKHIYRPNVHVENILTEKSQTVTSNYSEKVHSSLKTDRMFCDIELNGDKVSVISTIPLSGIKRVNPLPVKKLMRLFIRTFAYKENYCSQYSPWIVEPEMVRKYQIKDKVAEVFVRNGKKKPIVTKSSPMKKKKRPSNFGSQSIQHFFGSTSNDMSKDKKSDMAEHRKAISKAAASKVLKNSVARSNRPKWTIDLTAKTEVNGAAVSDNLKLSEVRRQMLREKPPVMDLTENEDREAQFRLKFEKIFRSVVYRPKKAAEKVQNSQPASSSDVRAMFALTAEQKQKIMQDTTACLQQLYLRMLANPSARKRYLQKVRAVAGTVFTMKDLDQISNEQIKKDIEKRLQIHAEMRKVRSMTASQKEEYFKQRKAQRHRELLLEREREQKQRVYTNFLSGIGFQDQ